MANSFSASSLCPDLCEAVASRWWTSGFPGVRRSAVRKGGTASSYLFNSNETKSPAQIGFREIGIELGRLGKSRDRLIPFLVTPGKFSQNVVRTSIVRVDLDLFQEFLLRTFRRFGPGIRPREQQPT